ncbi:hypothetical protein L6452_19208 [Arctium lappa]|uniref:Uncharacterized protein n=1 Tax=Arctium lappa TaxID=4217 RepID=A0ACB9B794_ARCLA|nr:hypothetical protein L6452_19208 [Arctium lappa]
MDSIVIFASLLNFHFIYNILLLVNSNMLASCTSLWLMENIHQFLTPQPKAKYAYLINTIVQDGADLSLQEPKTSSEAEDFSIFRSRRLS